MTPRLRLIVAGCAVLTTIAWFCWWSTTGHQVERTFARLSAAVNSGSAGGVVDLIHLDYPFRRCWPQLGKEASGDGAKDDRRLALRALPRSSCSSATIR